jgi:HEAT repeat protein
VAGVVARMADDDTPKQLIALANDGSAPAPRRAGAAIALGLLPKPGNPGEVSSALQGLLNVTDSADVRVAAADALGRLGAKDAAGALTGKVGDADPEVAIAVLRTLARFKTAEAVSAISTMIKEGGPKVTDPSKGDKKDEALEFAVVALGEIGSAEGIPGLVVARASARRVIAQNAQLAINKIAASDKGAVAKLLEWTTGEKVLENQKLPYLRAAACRALAGLPAEARSDEVTAALVSRIIDREIPKQVADYDQSVRLAAAEGLVAIGSDKGAAALVRCLRDGDGLPLKGDIRLVAAEGLDKIVTGDKPGKWEPAEGAKMEELLKLWGQFVGNWEAWQAKRAK